MAPLLACSFLSIELIMTHSMQDLLTLMARLRDPHCGCPWDRAQNFATIAPFTIEEAYEVVDAIEQEDYIALRDELGDLLLQVVYHAQMASEQSLFDFDQVVDGLYRKLVRRHPHLFGDASSVVALVAVRGDDEDAATREVNLLWEKVKQTERNNRVEQVPSGDDVGAKSWDEAQLAPGDAAQLVSGDAAQSSHRKSGALLDGVSKRIPGLTRAVKLQKRAAQVGFDWTSPHQVIEKLHEEIGEIEEAIEREHRDDIEDELGDLLFVCTNLARKLGLDPEMAVRRANRKFERRFRQIEALLDARQIPLETAGIDLLNACWEEAKRLESRVSAKE